MGLRIVSGKLKGQRLKGPKGAPIRPAAARVRKSLFEILGDLSGKEVLDLFAGSGAMGLEALSRGANHVTFVDANQQAVSLLFQNLEKTGQLEKCHIMKRKVTLALEALHRKKQRFDVIFVDPPYDQGQIRISLKKISEYGLLAPGGSLLCEHSPREYPDFLSGLQKVDERKYGQTIVSFFKTNPNT